MLDFVGYNPSELLSECQGDCDKDSECQPGLYCFKRDGLEPVPGCFDTGKSGIDYCYNPLSLPPNPSDLPALTFIAHNPQDPLSECQGDCDHDSECHPGLYCFRRAGIELVPGCSGAGKFSKDYVSIFRSIPESITKARLNISHSLLLTLLSVVDSVTILFQRPLPKFLHSILLATNQALSLVHVREIATATTSANPDLLVFNVMDLKPLPVVPVSAKAAKITAIIQMQQRECRPWMTNSKMIWGRVQKVPSCEGKKKPALSKDWARVFSHCHESCYVLQLFDISTRANSKMIFFGGPVKGRSIGIAYA